MRPYPWLFKEDEVCAKEVYAAGGERIVPVPEGFAPKGKVVISTKDALDLVAYLLSLDHAYPIEVRKGTVDRATPWTADELR